MRKAADNVVAFTRGKSIDDFQASEQLQWSVERGFEIMGEALTQLRKLEPEIANLITDHRKIISFRNVLIHGYSQVNNVTTWDIIQRDLPVLQRELNDLLARATD